MQLVPLYAMEYPKFGPDTPCKSLATEAEEEAQGLRYIADKKEKLKHAVENYYTQVDLKPEWFKDRLDGKPNGKERSEITLADYAPDLQKPPHMRRREIPNEPWGIVAMKENLKDDPDWLKKEHLRIFQEADKARLVEITSELLPALEAKMEAAKEAGGGLAEGEKIVERTAYKRGDQFAKVDKDGLTDSERRKLRLYRNERDVIQSRFNDDGVYAYVPLDDEVGDMGLPGPWKELQDGGYEEVKIQALTDGGEFGTKAYRLLNDIKEGFEMGGYVQTWDGKYYLKEECVIVDRKVTGRYENTFDSPWVRKAGLCASSDPVVTHKLETAWLPFLNLVFS
jgi:hypothetical protein